MLSAPAPPGRIRGSAGGRKRLSRKNRAAADLVSLAVAPQIRYRVARWEATPDAMYTRTGWLNIERRMVPLARIQTVDVSRGPIMRHFGLTDVKVTTASSQGDIEIEALDDVNAQALLEELTRAAAAVRGDGT